MRRFSLVATCLLLGTAGITPAKAAAAPTLADARATVRLVVSERTQATNFSRLACRRTGARRFGCRLQFSRGDQRWHGSASLPYDRARGFVYTFRLTQTDTYCASQGGRTCTARVRWRGSFLPP